MSEHHPPAPHNGPSFNIEVPSEIHHVKGSSYFRVGAFDPSSKREEDYFKHAEEAPEPGVLMISPAELVQIAESEVKVKTSAEEIEVTTAGTRIIKAAYGCEENGTFREIAYKYGRETSWTMADSQSFKMASETSVSLTNDQKISLSAGFGATMGLESAIKSGPLSIEIDGHGIEVKAPILKGEYKTSTHDHVEGGEALSLTLNPLNQVYLAKVQEYVTALKRLTTLLTVIAAVPIVGSGAMLLAKPISPGHVSEADVTWLKKQMGDLGTVGKVELGLLTVLQVAAGLLGSMAVINKATAAANPLLPKIEMTATGIKMSVGPTSSIELTPAGIRLQGGLASNIALNAAGAEMIGSSASISTPDTMSTMRCGPGRSLVAGASVEVSGRMLELSGDAVSIVGNVNVGVSAPAISFGV